MRLAADTVTIPEPSVTPLPALFPLSVKLTVLPLTPVPPEVRVADKSAVPPKVPDAAATVSVVARAGVSLKHTVTSCRLTVAVLSVVLSDA